MHDPRAVLTFPRLGHRQLDDLSVEPKESPKGSGGTVRDDHAGSPNEARDHQALPPTPTHGRHPEDAGGNPFPLPLPDSVFDEAVRNAATLDLST